MDTQALTAFLSVAELQSFSEAAEKLHLTQPAVSKRIATLEKQLDCRLFDRIGRHVHLTEAGRSLLPVAQRVLQELRNARRQINDLRGTVAGRLTMGISHHIGLHRLPPVLREFTRRYPAVQLDIDFMDSELAHQRILQGEMDLAVITLSPSQEENLSFIPVWEDSLTVAVWQGTSLVKKAYRHGPDLHGRG